MPDVELENLTKVYAHGVVAVENLNLHIASGELLALVGPSGCGKTTILRLIAGLEQPTAGTIRLGSKVANNMPPEQREVGFVFQRPALYPHRTVRDNLGFSLSIWHGGWWRRFSANGRQQAAIHRERVSATATLLGLEAMLDRFPAQLSGGQQQRVALGRALIRQPGVLLLDEPLSNLDANLRQELRRELHFLQRQLQATMIFVTHDPVEALSLGDRVAVLEAGHLRQVDRPEVLLKRPANRFVASFVGWPPMNFLDGEIQHHSGTLVFVTCAGQLPLPSSRIESLGEWIGKPLTLGFRPEDVRLVNEESPHSWAMAIRLVEHLGNGVLITLTGPQVEFAALLREGCQMPARLAIMRVGSNAMVQVNLENGHLFDRASGAALTVRSSG